MKKLSAQDRRRARDAIRKAAALDAKHQHELALAKATGIHEGHRAGSAQGAKVTRDAVLDHAGRLYKEGKDTDAAAVREVHRLLLKTGA